MAGKANFTPEEWSRVVASPVVASMAITAADPGGLWSLLQESMASGWALLEAKQDAQATPLVKEVADDIANAETRNAVRESFQAQFKGSQLADIKRKAVEELHAVSSLLDAKAPDEAPAFKAWLWSVARKSAEAGKEGGFLGFGGVTVSDAEKATLADIAAALGNPAGSGAGLAET
ncbi:hypothetical protein [Microvirga lotononidis]|uniref:Uncharacterized protein n=1 Tax=Microvirga lotononidis TaxID=864069 RepID=I4YL81_9HYPH|nr:hypothetical protein [Microvirga lotononidis]EIM24723.1 hypothetical protein MicloDRAFT_00054400 [Microvirga lotononidis]WQO26730.1 hypothetical protein U0023_18980 [Microvirga lotononidis]